jgi:hypothetical protein
LVVSGLGCGGFLGVADDSILTVFFWSVTTDCTTVWQHPKKSTCLSAL